MQIFLAFNAFVDSNGTFQTANLCHELLRFSITTYFRIIK